MRGVREAGDRTFCVAIRVRTRRAFEMHGDVAGGDGSGGREPRCVPCGVPRAGGRGVVSEAAHQSGFATANILKE